MNDFDTLYIYIHVCMYVCIYICIQKMENINRLDIVSLAIKDSRMFTNHQVLLYFLYYEKEISNMTTSYKLG